VKKSEALSLVSLEIADLLTLYKFKSPDNTGDEFCKIAAKNIVEFFLHNLGMRPPYVGQEFANALTSIYMGADYYQWEEDVEKDEQVMEHVKKHRELAAMTPEQREARRESFREARRKLREETLSNARNNPEMTELIKGAKRGKKKNRKRKKSTKSSK
jgi:hypothetical protein